MTADEIRYFLRLRYSRTWAFYEEFRPFTGFAGNINQIDAIAVGLYEKNRKIIAFEIKTDRHDFIDDVSRFQYKHRFALELSHQFFYVCPWGLIDKTEVPDVAGLMYVNRGNRLQIKKMAQLRVWDKLDFSYFQAFLQNSKRLVSYADIPVEYLGRNWTQKDFLELVEKRAQEEMKRLYEFEIEQKVKDKLKKENASCLKLSRILGMARLGWEYGQDEDKALMLLEDIIKRGLATERIKRCFDRLREELSQIAKEIPE